MKTFISILFLAFSQLLFSQKKEILNIISEQQAAWNRGDLRAFMSGYWKSDQLVFIGKNGPSYGWDKALENYQKSYPTPEKMGELTFNEIDIKKLNHKYAYVTGAWQLIRTSDVLKGYYTLLFKKINGKWLIVSDHSS